MPAWLTDELNLWLHIFTIDTLRYFAGVGLILVLLFVLARSWSERFRIQARRASALDIRREIGWSLITTAVYACVGLLTVRVERSGASLIYADLTDYSLTLGSGSDGGWLFAALSLAAVLVLHDTYFYWVHRAMHHPKLFKLFHRLHHLSRTPTAWASYSFAPGEAVAMALFMPIAVVLVPMHVAVIFAFLAIMIVRNAMGHCGVEFHPRWWVDTPLNFLTTVTHHDLHHQKFTGNYGLYFTWWDRWMGTEFANYKDAFRRAASGKTPLPSVDAAPVSE